MYELDATLVIIIGLIAVFIATVLKLLIARAGVNIGRGWVTGGLFVISCVVAWFWVPPEVPVIPQITTGPPEMADMIVEYINQWVITAGSIIGFATLIYNVLMQKVFDKMGWITEKRSMEIKSGK